MAGRDLRPVDNKNIGGADVYFANQFLQQENIGKNSNQKRIYNFFKGIAEVII